jgi:hypothetical protein
MFQINHFSNLKVAFILNNTSEFILQAEVFLKVSAEFASSITANTIKVQMPLPKYTTRYYLYILLMYQLINDKRVCFTDICLKLTKLV